jgi:hypothetical protein
MLRSHPHIFNATRVPVQWKKKRRKKKKKIDRNFFSSLLRWFYELDAVRYMQPKKNIFKATRWDEENQDVDLDTFSIIHWNKSPGMK